MQPLVGNYTSGCVFGTRGYCRWELIGMLPDEVLKRAEQPITKSCQVDNQFPFLDSVTEIFHPILYIFPFNFIC